MDERTISLTLSLLPGEFAVCRLDARAAIPAWAVGHALFAIVRTSEETSVVCPSSAVPEGVVAERGWRCLKVHGPLVFEQVGVLASLAVPLARAGVSIFAISTYDTDYLLIKGHDLPTALAALRQAGHRVDESVQK